MCYLAILCISLESAVSFPIHQESYFLIVHNNTDALDNTTDDKSSVLCILSFRKDVKGRKNTKKIQSLKILKGKLFKENF